MEYLFLNKITPVSLILIYMILYKLFICNFNSIIDDSLIKQKYGEKYKNKILSISCIATIFIVVAIHLINKNFNFNLPDYVIWYYAFIIIIYTTQIINAFITDLTAHEICRYIGRLGYLSMLIVFICLSFYQITKVQIVSVIGMEIFTVIMLFIFISIGAADFRILFMIIACSILLNKDYFIFTILLPLFISSLYQFIIQRKNRNRKMNVPIGPCLLITSFIMTIINMLCNLNIIKLI